MRLSGKYKLSDFRKSFVLSRTFILLIMAIVFSAVLILVWYNFMNRHYHNRAIINELTQKAQVVGRETALYENGTISADAFNHFLRTAPDLLQTGIAMDMNKDVTWSTPRRPSNAKWSPEDLSLLNNHIGTFVDSIQAKQKVIFTTKLGKENNGDTVICVGVPILSITKDDRPEEVLGGIYAFRSMDDYQTSSSPIIISFLASFLLTLSMMAFPAYYYITLIVRPLLQIRDVAKGISDGDLSKRAEINSQAEFGELATSINQMADHLQLNIADLEAESNRLQQILNGLNEGIIAYTAKLHLAHLNPVFREYFSECQNLELGSSINDLPVEDIREAINEAVATGTTQYITISVGELLLFGQLLLLHSADKTFQGVVGLFRDVTKEQQLEQTRRDYVSNVSHELKTPLTAIRCMVEPIIDGLIKDPDRLQRYYHIIYDEVLRMARLIDDMLELSRLQSGKAVIELEPCQLQTLLENLYAKFSSVAKEKQINFALELPNCNLPLAYVNPDRIEQIIYVFLDNASKFTPPGGDIILRAALKDDRIIIVVQDTGKGIAAEDKAHVFERFYKADKSHGSIGTGLGLSIVKEITEKTGEKVWVESELGHGAAFYISVAVYNNQDACPIDKPLSGSGGATNKIGADLSGHTSSDEANNAE